MINRFTGKSDSELTQLFLKSIIVKLAVHVQRIAVYERCAKLGCNDLCCFSNGAQSASHQGDQMFGVELGVPVKYHVFGRCMRLSGKKGWTSAKRIGEQRDPGKESFACLDNFGRIPTW